MQSNHEVIGCAILGELVWRMEKVLYNITSNRHIFFSTPQNNPKKNCIQNHNDTYPIFEGKKLEFLKALFEQPHFS